MCGGWPKSFKFIIRSPVIGIFDQMIVHLPTLKQLQYLVALRRHRPFRQRRRGLLRHPVDAVRRHPRARDPARRDPGRAHPPRRPLHRARRANRRQGASASCARPRNWPTWPAPQGQPLHGELRMGVIPTIAPFLLPTMLPRLRAAMARAQALPARGDQPARPATRFTAASSTACCSPFPSLAAKSRMRGLFDDRLFVAFPRGEAPTAPTVDAGCDRRRPAAAARGRPLPQGPCAVRLQPARASRPGGDDGHLAAHAGADGRQRARPDLHPGNGDRGRAFSAAPASTRGRSMPSTAPAASR